MNMIQRFTYGCLGRIANRVFPRKRLDIPQDVEIVAASSSLLIWKNPNYSEQFTGRFYTGPVVYKAVKNEVRAMIALAFATLRPEFGLAILLDTDTFDSNKDSYIRDTATSENNGTATVIDVRWRSGLWIYRGLVQADLSTIAGATINSASFVVNITLFSEWTTANVDLERITSSWTETGVTWGNQPTTTTTNKASREFTSSHTGTQSWSMTALMQDLVDNTNNGIMIKRATAGSGSNNEAMQLDSREGTTAPYFDVDYEPAPAAPFIPKVMVF